MNDVSLLLTLGGVVLGLGLYHILLLFRRRAALARDSQERLRRLRYLVEVLNGVFDAVEDELRPGITPAALAAFMEEMAHRSSVRSSIRNFRGFPEPAAISVNESFLHGVPSLRPIVEGDVVHIQFGVTDGMAYAHQAWAYALGETSSEWDTVLATAKRGLVRAADAAHGKGRVGAISEAIQAAADEASCVPNREFVGCGIWYQPFGWPPIPCWPDPKRAKIQLPMNQAILVQSIMHVGASEIRTLPDHWAIASADDRPAVALSQMLFLNAGDSEPLTPLRTTRLDNATIRDSVV